uniref:TonB family protein n=1 Tax=uncultured bacterium UPO46 TaxID=1776971 RepID=A0A126SY65_9BACT|nr:TonB family protein [uncultured bacterium UPO46]
MPRYSTSSHLAGLSLVILLHAAILWGLWRHYLAPPPARESLLFVNFIAPPEPEQAPEPQRPKPSVPKPVKQPQRQLVAETPLPALRDEFVAPAPEPVPEPSPAPAIQTPLPSGPVALGSELALACPDRQAPAYPPLSRRLGETGRVVLRVELNEQGTVAAARIEKSSGFASLDTAALAAVRRWRCNAPTSNGQPVQAVALQPFHFVLAK